MATKKKNYTAAAKAEVEEAAADTVARTDETTDSADADKLAADRAADSAETPPASDAEISKPADDVIEKAPGKKIELRDKDAGFYDRVTGFQVVRDQQVALGKTIGDATREALQSGRLLIVGGEKKAAKKS